MDEVIEDEVLDQWDLDELREMAADPVCHLGGVIGKNDPPGDRHRFWEMAQMIRRFRGVKREWQNMAGGHYELLERWLRQDPWEPRWSYPCPYCGRVLEVHEDPRGGWLALDPESEPMNPDDEYCRPVFGLKDEEVKSWALDLDRLNQALYDCLGLKGRRGPGLVARDKSVSELGTVEADGESYAVLVWMEPTGNGLGVARELLEERERPFLLLAPAFVDPVARGLTDRHCLLGSLNEMVAAKADGTLELTRAGRHELEVFKVRARAWDRGRKQEQRFAQQQQTIEEMAEGQMKFNGVMLSHLTRQEAAAFMLYTSLHEVEGEKRLLTQAEIGQRLRIGRSRVCQLIKQVEERFPLAQGFMEGIRRKQAKTRLFSELSPQLRNEYGLGEFD